MKAARFNADGQSFDADDLEGALGAEHAARLRALDGAPSQLAGPPGPPASPLSASERQSYDVVLAGGGLSTLLAPLLARRGLRVAVVDRAPVARAHREWNASADELEALTKVGLLSAAELDALVLNAYDHGTCHWHGHPPTAVRGVLDRAVDASGLLGHARRLAERAGVHCYDRATVVDERVQADGVQVAVRRGRDALNLEARVLVDARGVQSPHARHDLACPTVGGVLEDLEQGEGERRWQAHVGEILASTEGCEDGAQHLWEAFPGRPGQLTVYLFAYRPRGAVPAGALERLYRRFWNTLGRYKRGRPRLVRPTYGIIPGWSRLTPAARSPHRRLLLVGDAAARHSPLTFCGFGAMLRSLPVALEAIDAVLARPTHGRAPLAVDDGVLHQATGALAHMMAHPPAEPRALNDLLAAAFATLQDMGNEPYAALLKDRMSAADMVRFLWRTSRRHPAVWRQVQQGLGLGRALTWSGRLGARALLPST